MTCMQFAVLVYNHVLRRSYEIIVSARDTNHAWAQAEFVLGWPNLDDRTYVVRVRAI